MINLGRKLTVEDNPTVVVPLKEIVELEAQNNQLRKALEVVEWYYVYDDPKTGTPVMKCPRCERRLGLGHKEDCGTKQALAATKGASPGTKRRGGE